MQQEIAKNVTDVAAGSVAFATIVSWLPPAAAAFTIIWTTLRIYEMFMGQGSLERMFKRWMK